MSINGTCRTLVPLHFVCLTLERERTPLTSLRECLEQPEDRRLLWRNWFVLLLVAPLLYYLIFIRSSEQYELLTNEKGLSSHRAIIVLSEITEKPTTQSSAAADIQPMMQIIVEDSSQTSRDIMANQQYEENRRRIEKNQGQDKAASINATSESDLPWCKYVIDADTVVKPKNASDDQFNRKYVKIGGHFVPTQCKPRHKVAILVPFRDREMNLAVFLYNIHAFLIDQLLEYRIFVIEQKGKGLFNKGRLFNAGYQEAKKLDQWDCLVFHDVDLLPMSKLIQYTCPTWPRHMCPTVVEDQKNHSSSYHSFFGGVSSMTLKHFESVNGYSNLYWGWGGEDTDMFWRLRAAGIPIVRYNKDIAKYVSLPHIKSPECKNRNVLVKTAMERYTKDGLSSLSYKVVSIKLWHLYTRILVDIQTVLKKARRTTLSPSDSKPH